MHKVISLNVDNGMVSTVSFQLSNLCYFISFPLTVDVDSRVFTMMQIFVVSTPVSYLECMVYSYFCYYLYIYSVPCQRSRLSKI